MAAQAQKVAQIVKPHIRLIRFPDRSVPQNTAPAAATVVPAQQFTAPPSQPTAPKTKPVGSLPRGSGILEKDMPARYRRKVLSDEEIEYIFRGGPE